MRKLSLSVLLCFVMAMGLLSAAAFAAEPDGAPEPAAEAQISSISEGQASEGQQASQEGQASEEAQQSEEKQKSEKKQLLGQGGQANQTEFYVSSAGDDANNTGAKDSPFATLAKAVEAAPDGATIYVMSDLSMDKCARFFDKSLKITSGEGGPYTITRAAGFKQQSDSARGWYNPAMIEVQTSSSSSISLTLSNIILDDAGMTEGTVFAQAVSDGGETDNTVYAQDAIIASNATVSCTITLGEGAVLRNFGGMSAVRATEQAKILMKSGSVIEDTIDGLTRTRGTAEGSVGPAGAAWLQGGTLVMEAGSKIQNINGRGVYADDGKVEISGTISGIAGSKEMWQNGKENGTSRDRGINGTAIHLRNNAEGTLNSTALITGISNGGMVYCADGAKSFEMKSGSKITDCPELNGDAIYAQNSTVVIDGEISNVYATGKHILSTAGGTKVTIGENGTINNNHANYGTVYINGTDEQLDIYGKINNNVCTDRGGGVVLSNNGGNHNATMYPNAEICGNICAQTGGGIMVSKGSFTMNGGSISNNISGTDAKASEGDRTGGGVFVRRGGQFIMNDGKIENNTTTAFGGGVCFDASDYGGMVPRAELNGGAIQNNLMQATVSGEYQVTGGVSNDLAITSKDYGKSDRYLAISDEATVGNKAVYFKTDGKTVLPGDNSLDIKLGNTSAANVTALTDASKSLGWDKPLATFWVQRGGAAELTVDGLTLNDLPVYVLALPVDETGIVPSGSDAQVYEAQKSGTGEVGFTLPDVSGNGYAVAIVQASQDCGTLTISGPETIEQNETGADYSVTYTVTYDISESLKSIIEQSGSKPEYELVIAQDSRLTGTPGSFDGQSIEVAYSLPNSEFKAGDTLLASAKLTITVGQGKYVVPSNVAKTQMLEAAHTHVFNQELQKPEALKSEADCTHDAVYYKSCVCGAISTTETFTAAGTKLGHDWSKSWSMDDDNHWLECDRCHAVKDEAAHSFVWKIDRKATASEEGLKHEVCTVCGYTRSENTVIDKRSDGNTDNNGSEQTKGNSAKTPQTGDTSNAALWIALLLASGGAVTAATFAARKKKHNK